MGGIYSTGQVELQDSNDLDAFGRLRTSSPFVLFDSQNQYNDGSALFWQNTLTGGGTVTHLPNESSVSMAVTSASGDKVSRQTKQYFHYQPGRSQIAVFTAVLGAKKTGVRQRGGYFDDSNGAFFEQDANNLKVVVRSNTTGSPVDTAVNQSSWNIDKFDGTGPSGVTLDASKAQIFVIDLQWLGVGRVRFGFVINGELLYCHQVFNANALTSVYMTTANLPVRFELENTSSASGSTTMKQICCMVASEGGYDKVGLAHSISNGISGKSITARNAILSIRPKATFNSIVNRALVLPNDFDLLVATNNILWELVYNGTLGGSPSWTSAGTNSVVEYDTAGTTVTGGELIDAGFIPAGTKNNPSPDLSNIFLSKLPLCLDASGANPTIFSIVATPFTGTATVNAALSWREIYC